MSAPVSPFPDLPDLFRCMVCGRPHAPYGVGWPGRVADAPTPVRGKRVRLCAFDGACHARAICRAEVVTGMTWPWPPNADPALRARVAALAETERPRAKDPPPRPAPAAHQPTLL